MAGSTINILMLLILVINPVLAATDKAMVPFEGKTSSLMGYEFKVGQFLWMSQTFVGLGTQYSTKSFEGLDILCKQSNVEDQPPAWILVDLIMGPDEVSTLAFRNDNLYFIGFTNSSSDWFAFANSEHLIAKSTKLPFTGSYNENNGVWPRNQLQSIPLGRTSTEQAIRTLLSYNEFADTQSLKLSLATLILTISEAGRFANIRQAINDGWDTVSYIPSHQQLMYWSKLSCEIVLGWSTDEAEKYEIALKIKGKEEAKALLNVLIYGTKCATEIDQLPAK